MTPGLFYGSGEETMKPISTMIIHHRHGFTLIELMISVALGSLIVYTAVAGFRVASQSITITNRLALENALMRSGLDQACDRMDFWTDCDNPDNTAEQTLRTADPALNLPTRIAAEALAGYKSGLPFTPMRNVFPLGVSPDPEKTTGWNPQDRWPASESRTWFHGNFTQKARSNFCDGFYSIFSNVKDTHLVKGINCDYWFTMIGLSDYGTISVPHTWYMRQVLGMHEAIGYYGFADYMPANLIYVAYGDVSSGNGLQSLTNESNQWGDGNNWGPGNVHVDVGEILDPLVTNQDGALWKFTHPNSRLNQADENGRWNHEFPNGLGRLTQNGAFALVSPTFKNPTPLDSAIHVDNPKNPLAHQWKFAVGHKTSQAWTGANGLSSSESLEIQFTRYLKATDNTTKVIESGGPAHWPKAEVTVKRFIKNARYVQLCTLRWTSPVTGASAELSFTGFGSTLRGARQQRCETPTGGWAKWYGPTATTTFLPGERNDTTLDGDL
jgi:prepilin-type N-terminal cleavage/methylation domain-containing protein